MATVLVAPDSFKGTFSAVEVAEAIGRGLRAAGLECDLCPVADGGEGTMETLLASIGGEVVEVDGVLDPLRRPRRAPFELIEGGARAIVEMAAASGLGLVAEDERDAWAATTYGTGQLIHAAAEAGAAEIRVAVGGSATTDGGRGALEALDERGGIGDARVVVLCDVTTPWERCAEIYGPQKGADPDMVRRLTARLDADAADLPRAPRRLRARAGRRGGQADDRRGGRPVGRAVGRPRRRARAGRPVRARRRALRGSPARRGRRDRRRGAHRRAERDGQDRRRDRRARPRRRRAAVRDRRGPLPAPRPAR